MGRKGTIAVIPKDFGSAFPTMEKSLRQNGYSLAPGCFKFFFPYKENSKKWRTGLDPDAAYLNNIQNDVVRKQESERIKDLKEKLEKATQIDLSPTSPYWAEVQAVKLTDGDNFFDLDDPFQEITFSWLKVHPTVAASLEKYNQGIYPPETHYYVKDEEVETKINYNKIKRVNDALIKLNSFDLEKRRKVARLLGLPITEETKEEVVYTALDSYIKKPTVELGSFKGQDPVTAFETLSSLDPESLRIRDLVAQAISNQIYREGKAKKIFEGDVEVFRDKDAMIEYYLDDKNQLDLIELESKLKFKLSSKV